MAAALPATRIIRRLPEARFENIKSRHLGGIFLSECVQYSQSLNISAI